MSAKDTLLLEEAYNLVMINEGFFPSFILDKIKSFFANIVSQAKQQQPQEFNKLVSVLQSKDMNALKQLFNQYNVEAELKKLSGTQNESFITEGSIGSAFKYLENILIKLSNFVMGKPGTTRNYVSLALMAVLAIAQIIVMFKAPGAVELGMGLVEYLTSTGAGILTSATYMILPLILGTDRSHQANMNQRSKP